MHEPSKEQDELAKKVINCAFTVHKELGPGLLEKVYEDCLVSLFDEENISYERQKEIPVIFRGKNINVGYKADIIIENKLIIELKTVDAFLPVHKAQIMTYMKLSGINLGLLINFNTVLIKDGIKRVILS